MRYAIHSTQKKPDQRPQSFSGASSTRLSYAPKACGKEYAIDLHGDLAGILTVSAGKQQKINENRSSVAASQNNDRIR